MSPEILDLFQRVGMALAIGLLVGVERGWRHRDAPEGTRVAGLRTHAIVGLAGGITGAITLKAGPIALAALTLAFATPFVMFKLREHETEADVSVTGTIAGLLVFALGVYAVLGDVRLAAAAGVALTVFLAFKQPLHSWLKAVTAAELNSALLILAMSAIALPLLPDRAIDPWGAINPRELWVLTIVLAAASFAGYVAVRVFGRDLGLLAGAVVGAIVSSTAMTAELGRRVRAGDATPNAAAAAADLAAVVSLVRVTILASIAAAPAALLIWPCVVAAAATFVLAGLLLRRFAPGAREAASHAALESPLNIKAVALFAFLLGAILIGSRIAAAHFGEAGLLSLAATGGLADVDAVTLAAGSLIRDGLSPVAAAHGVLAAIVVNTFAKAVIGWITGGWRYAAAYFGSAVAATLAGGATFWLLASAL